MDIYIKNCNQIIEKEKYHKIITGTTWVFKVSPKSGSLNYITPKAFREQRENCCVVKRWNNSLSI